MKRKRTTLTKRQVEKAMSEAAKGLPAELTLERVAACWPEDRFDGLRAVAALARMLTAIGVRRDFIECFAGELAEGSGRVAAEKAEFVRVAAEAHGRVLKGELPAEGAAELSSLLGEATLRVLVAGIETLLGHYKFALMNVMPQQDLDFLRSCGIGIEEGEDSEGGT